MSVLGSGIKLLFCEGQPDAEGPGSLDKRLLTQLLRGKPPTTVIVPAGGKHQLRAFIRGWVQAGGRPADYLALRDRDFDALPPTEVGLIPFRSGQPIFMTYRAAIENYLLDAALIHRYWDENSRVATRWTRGQSPGESDIRSWMDQAAKVLTSYQAVRWALAQLKPGDRWPEVNTTWTQGSGHLPSSLEAKDCLEQASKLVSNFLDDTRTVSAAHLEGSYEKFFAQFSSSDFVSRADYTIWFHGKDLVKSMQKLRPDSISIQHYCSWAVDNLEWSHHADLRELAEMI